jgi:hypothetical protein
LSPLSIAELLRAFAEGALAAVNAANDGTFRMIKERVEIVLSPEDRE